MTGPDHKPIFKSVIKLSGKKIGEGVGNSKKAAKMSAAKAAIKKLKKVKMRGRRGLDNAGEYFDLEIEKAGKDLEVDWGRPDYLYLMCCSKG